MTDAEKIEKLEAQLARYRKLVGFLATRKDKTAAWYHAKSWADNEFWRSIGHDLKTEVEQIAFLFGS